MTLNVEARFDELMQASWADVGDPIMQIRMFAMPELRQELGLEQFQWPDTPTIFVVRDGRILVQWFGETAEGWTEVELESIYDAFAIDDPSLLPAAAQWEELQ